MQIRTEHADQHENVKVKGTTGVTGTNPARQ